jgi:hexosaminidase
MKTTEKILITGLLARPALPEVKKLATGSNGLFVKWWRRTSVDGSVPAPSDEQHASHKRQGQHVTERKIMYRSGIWMGILVGLLLLQHESSAQDAVESAVGCRVVPKPLKVEPGEGSFTLTAETVIGVSSPELSGVGRYLAELLAPAAGFKLAVASDSLPKSNVIVLKLDAAQTELGDEGYRLTCTPTGVVITAARPAGVFYGVQTLRQLLPVEIENPQKVEGVAWRAPCVAIEDRPRFKWRGYMLDTARHFRTKAEVMRMIDLVAMLKLNIFHLHLTDNEGWRVEIKRYPLLVETGSRVPDKSGNVGEGRFYTQEDIREIVQYAADRFITVVPEIEMPGHNTALTTAYPELSCTGKPAQELCVSRERTFEFMCGVLDEVLALFPSPYIHIGADEVKPRRWQMCPSCSAMMKQLAQTELPDDVTSFHPETPPSSGISFDANTARMQGEFVRRIDRFLTSRGRRMVGWDEILEGGLNVDSPAIAMAWRGDQMITGAVETKRDVVVTLVDYYYLNRGLPFEHTYAFEPIPDNLTPEQAKHILGVQGNLWGERLRTPKWVDFLTFPNLCAIAEAGWTPREARDFADFSTRMTPFLQRLELMGVRYHRHGKSIKWHMNK